MAEIYVWNMLMQKQKTPHKILQILKDGKFHSGQDIGNKLNITRSAVWKGIQQLTQNGLDIQSIIGRGYRIEGGLSLLDEEHIRQHLPTVKQSKILLTLLDQTTSTNDFLLNNKQPYRQTFHFVLAEQQTQGRGRRGRHWVSPYGHNIYCSLRWQCHKDPLEIAGLSLAAAIAVIRSLKAYGVSDGLNVKWPNDILYHKQKLAGILVDLHAESHGTTTVIIGIGLNTTISATQAQTIEQPYTSLSAIQQPPIDRNRLAALIMSHLIDVVHLFDREGLTPFLPEWHQHDRFYGQPVVLQNETHVIEGIMQGISEQGELLLKNRYQQTQKIICGEMHLRKG